MHTRYWIGGMIVVVVIVVAALVTPSLPVKGTMRIVGGVPSAPLNGANYYEIAVTHRGVRMLVRPADIYKTGRDGSDVVPIASPLFVSVEEADATNYLFDDHYGLTLYDGERMRFYPMETLSWHEQVYDTIGGQRVIIAYSPLTELLRAYHVENEQDFGYSGYVWNNASLLLDRESRTLYSPLLDRGVYGPDAGRNMRVYPHRVLRWSEWKQTYPDGWVLTPPAGSSLPYQSSPYGTYLTAKSIYFPLAHPSNAARRPKDALWGFAHEGGAKAYDAAAIVKGSDGVKNDVFGGRAFVVWMDEGSAFHMNERGDERFVRVKGDTLVTQDGDVWTVDPITWTLHRGDEQRGVMRPMRLFWFAWAATYPQTEIYGNVLGQGLIDGTFSAQEARDDDAVRIDVDGERLQQLNVEAEASTL